ncbi:MAG: immune inhibitor A [Bacteroidales bacterium]|nr:immune inhibitor A [Bacteroidales bacterium]
MLMNRLVSTLLFTFLAAASLGAANTRLVVIPVEFKDVVFTDTNKYIYEKTELAQRYLSSQFGPVYGDFSIDVLPVVRLSFNMSHYGANSTTIKDFSLDEAVKVACIQSSANFAPYDNDNDGFIDNICLITAGASEAEGGGSYCIWPQQGFLHDWSGTIQLSGKTADSFTVCPEFASAGTFCHELGHVFGLQDMYDTDGRLSGGTSKGLWGSLSLMDSGGALPCLNAVELEQLGMGTSVSATPGHITLSPLSARSEYMRLESDNPGEYFLFECRDNSGWDECLPSAGLVIYHIDRSASDAWYSDAHRRNLSAAERWEYNQVNCRPEHPCARVIEAVPGTDDPSEVFFPGDGHFAFGSETDPPFRFWSGGTSRYALNNISLEPDGSVSFDLIVPIVITGTDVFQDAAIIGWTVDRSISFSHCSVIWYSEESGSSGSKTVYYDDSGIYSATIEGLNPHTSYQVVVRVLADGGTVFSRSLGINTKTQMADARPFIYLSGTGRADDGSFPAGSSIPMRIYNAKDAARVMWYFNGWRIYPGADGYWKLTESGTLKAEVWYPDGSCEIIIKEIRVK